MCYIIIRKTETRLKPHGFGQEESTMCNGPKRFGIDFNNDGDVSFEESYLTYRISEDIINSNNDDSDDDFGGSDDYSDSYSDFDGDDF